MGIMEKNMEIAVGLRDLVYRDHIGIMEKNMEITIRFRARGLGFGV